MENQFILEDDNVLYEIKWAAAFIESKEDFKQHAAAIAIDIKNKFDKVIILGTVNGKVIQTVIGADRAGILHFKIKSKKDETGRTDLGGKSDDSPRVEGDEE